jgi:hypothetical protein
MGHFRIKFQKGGAQPTFTGGVRMNRSVEPGETIREPCRPYFGGWLVTFWQGGVENANADIRQDWQAHIDPGAGSELCAHCLEWVYLGATPHIDAIGDEPVVTIESAEDCRGLIVNIEGQDPPPENWTLQFNAALDNGQPFGWTAGFVIIGATEHVCEWQGDCASGELPCPIESGNIAVEYPPAAETWTISLRFKYAPIFPEVVTFEYSVVPDPASSDISIVEDVDGLGFPRLTFTLNSIAGGLPADEGWHVPLITIKLDGVEQCFGSLIEGAP